MNIAIIGYGRWGPKHARVFSLIKGINIKYICDQDKNKSKDVKKNFRNSIFTSNYIEIFKDITINSVIICVPLSEHYFYLKLALKYKKNVLCEKPLVDNSIKAKKIIDSFIKKKIYLQCGHIFLFNNCLKKVKQLSKRYIKGKMIINFTRMNLGPVRFDTNSSWDLSSHDIYMLLELTEGKTIDKVQSHSFDFNQKINYDSSYTTIFFKDGSIAKISTSWSHPLKVREMKIITSDKMIIWDDIKINNQINVYSNYISRKYENSYLDFIMKSQAKNLKNYDIKVNEPLFEQAKNFIFNIKNNSKKIEHLDKYFKTIKILDLIDKSAKNNSKVLKYN